MFLYTFDFYIFFFNDTATTEIYTLSLHDALPIFSGKAVLHRRADVAPLHEAQQSDDTPLDRKSTRLNSSHGYISYAVFCLKKKNNKYALIKKFFNIRFLFAQHLQNSTSVKPHNTN